LTQNIYKLKKAAGEKLQAHLRVEGAYEDFSPAAFYLCLAKRLVVAPANQILPGEIFLHDRFAPRKGKNGVFVQIR
jgi:hypothetical protein